MVRIAKGIPISHETIGEMGTVSWVHAAPFREEFRELEEWFSDDKSVELRSDKDFQFYPVVSEKNIVASGTVRVRDTLCGGKSLLCCVARAVRASPSVYAVKDHVWCDRDTQHAWPPSDKALQHTTVYLCAFTASRPALVV